MLDGLKRSSQAGPHKAMTMTVSSKKKGNDGSSSSAAQVQKSYTFFGRFFSSSPYSV
jgi:hypothetical protein